VTRLHRLIAAARRAEQRFELRCEHRADRRFAVLPRHLHALGRMPEVRQVELELSARAEMDERADLPGEARLAVRRQPHHLELVAVIGEAEVLRDRKVEHSQGVWKEDVSVHRDPRSGDTAPRRADEIAEPVDGADGGVVERRHERRARQVRRMMLDKARTGPHPFVLEAERVGEDHRQRANAGQVAGARRDRSPRPLPEEKPRLAPEMRPRVPRDGEDVDVGRHQATHLQARLHRLPRHAGIVLDPPIALFLDGRDELPITNQRRRHVAVVGVDAQDVHVVTASGSNALNRSRNRSSVNC
jgi:hypothetical protein